MLFNKSQIYFSNIKTEKPNRNANSLQLTAMKKNIPRHHLIAPRSLVSQEMRESSQVHKGMIFWLTGLSGSGKSTLAHQAELQLFNDGYSIVVLDGDAIRTGLCSDLGFSVEDRVENIRRVAELAKIIMRNGTVCVCALISPSIQARTLAKKIIGEEFFREVFISCSQEECERRDPKGFYDKARKGIIKNYTGISANYETPTSPDFIIKTTDGCIEDCAAKLNEYIKNQSKR